MGGGSMVVGVGDVGECLAPLDIKAFDAEVTEFAAREALHTGWAADFFEELSILGIIDMNSVVVSVSGVTLGFGQSFGEVRREDAAERREGPVDGECPFAETTRTSVLLLVEDSVSDASLEGIEPPVKKALAQGKEVTYLLEALSNECSCDTCADDQYMCVASQRRLVGGTHVMRSSRKAKQ